MGTSCGASQHLTAIGEQSVQNSSLELRLLVREKQSIVVEPALSDRKSFTLLALVLFYDLVERLDVRLDSTFVFLQLVGPTRVTSDCREQTVLIRKEGRSSAE